MIEKLGDSVGEILVRIAVVVILVATGFSIASRIEKLEARCDRLEQKAGIPKEAPK